MALNFRPMSVDVFKDDINYKSGDDIHILSETKLLRKCVNDSISQPVTGFSTKF